MTYEVVVFTSWGTEKMLSENERKNREQNRHRLSIVLEAIRLLAHQEIPICGNKEDESNLIQILKFSAKLCSALEKRSKMFIRHEIQNDILGLMSHPIIRNLLADIRGKLYSLRADEYTDITSK